MRIIRKKVAKNNLDILIADKKIIEKKKTKQKQNTKKTPKQL